MADWDKDPSAVLDYVFDWSRWLADSETITTSTITVSSGITLDSSSNTTTTATAWISGGTVGRPYTVTDRIVTNQGRTDDRTITIRVTNR
jgi:hypothetical protein